MSIVTEMKPSTGRRGRRGKAAGSAMDVVPAVRQKVARNLGEGKAKREAAVDKVRCRYYLKICFFLHYILHCNLYHVCHTTRPSLSSYLTLFIFF